MTAHEQSQLKQTMLCTQDCFSQNRLSACQQFRCSKHINMLKKKREAICLAEVDLLHFETFRSTEPNKIVPRSVTNYYFQLYVQGTDL